MIAHSQVVGNHSLKLSTFSVSYNYEYSFNNQVSVTGRAGLIMPTILWTSSGFHYSLNPFIGAEGRYYYNYEKRRLSGKSTMFHSGNFLSIDCKYIFGALKNSETLKNNTGFLISPNWGLKRVFKNKMFFELSPGLNLFYTEESNFYISPRANFSFGIIL